MSEMVEKVARAIDPTTAKVADMLIAKGLSREAVQSILPMNKARAAIEAMREPTEAMIEAVEGMSVGGPYLGPLDADAIFERMIDAALSEEGR